MANTPDLQVFDDFFPFRRFASLEKLIDFWQQRASSGSTVNATIASEVLTQLEKAPELKASQVSLEDLRKHPELLELMMTAVFPPARQDNIIASAFVPFAIHSDAPVTPLGPLFTAWCAVNRLTASGDVLGAYQRISIPTALRTITLGAAYTLKMDHEIGSIEAGKRADFCILDDDPLAALPRDLKDVQVHGTILDGKPTGADA